MCWHMTFGGARAARLLPERLRYRSLTIFDAVALLLGSAWSSMCASMKRLSGCRTICTGRFYEPTCRTAAYNPLSEQALEIYSAPWLGQ